MKNLKFYIHEMGIDINDVKILINACFKYLMKTCYQWAKDHPLVSCVMLFFYLLYIFFPSLFSIVFYTFPLVICLAILLGGPQLSLENHRNNQKIDNVANSTSLCDFTSVVHSNNRRPYLQTHNLSRRAFARLNKNSKNNKKLPDITEEKTQICTRITCSRSDSKSQSEDDEAQEQEKNKRVVEWTDHDQTNLMDLGTSEIDRNKRLESLIAKRKARKIFTMQPRRNIFYSFDQHDHTEHQVLGSTLVSREDIVDGDDLQPGSAPSVLLPTRNPFDLPYDPHEEKPVLTGGGFDEDFVYDELQYRDLFKDPFSRGHDNHDISSMEMLEDYPFLPSVLTKPREASDISATITRFWGESEENLKEIADELSMREVVPNKIQNEKHDEASTSQPKEEESPQIFENPFASDYEFKNSDHFISLPERKMENILRMESKTIIVPARDEARQIQDHVVLLDCKRYNDDDEDSSSSSSIEIRTGFNATKNEAFRNSVRKVLTCLAAFPKNKGLIPTKMQERSFYTQASHLSSNFSIASDMQVEVSDSGSPPMAAVEANYPTDQESYDGDVDKDVNSVDDEDLWGTSPHPTKLREFGKNFELKNYSDELEGKVHRASNLGNIVQRTESDLSPTLLPRVVEEGDVQQNTITGAVSSLSPRSILPDEGKNELEIDLQSTNGTILEYRSSSSSSSESLTSQMQSNKAEYLAEYLANLTPSECGSNLIEEGERSSYVREPSTETVQDESNPIFENDEHKEESREGSEGSSVESTSTSQVKAPKETSSSSNEVQAYDLNKEHVDQTPSIIEQNDHLRSGEDEDEPLVGDENEVNSSSKEAISDSYFTIFQEDISNQSRVGEDV